MKCLVVFLLLSLVSNVYSLALNVTSLNGYTAVVHWTQDKFDPVPLTFDLRFVIPPFYDVGLAMANIAPSSTQSFGNCIVRFTNNGTYLLVAVSGSPNNFQIGRTAVVEVPDATAVPTSSQDPTSSQIPTSSPTPTASPTPTPSSTISPSPSKSIPAMGAESLQHKPNVPAIVGGILGGIIFIAGFIFVVFHVCRKRSFSDARISFHGERMVQQRSVDTHNPSIGTVVKQGGAIVPYPFTAPGSRLTSILQSNRQNTGDIEQGLSVPSPVTMPLSRKPSESRPSTPLASSHIVPPPRGPRDRSKPVKRPESIRVNGGPTPRQRQLADKLGEVEKQIEEMKSRRKPSPSMVVLLDDLERQKAWLVKQRDSMWALEEINTPPPGFSRYMAKSFLDMNEAV